MHNFNTKKLSGQQRWFYGILISGFFALVMANIFVWLYLRRVKTVFISNLKFRLENIARSVAGLIDANDIELIIPEDDSDPQALYYQQILYEIKTNDRLQDIKIISTGRDILIDTYPAIDATIQIPDTDDPLIDRALGSEFVVDELQYLNNNIFLKAAIPIINTDNSVSSILMIEAPAEFFNTLDLYDNSLLIFSIVNGIVLLSVAILFYRSLGKIVRLQNQMQEQVHMAQPGEMAAAVAHEIRKPIPQSPFHCP